MQKMLNVGMECSRHFLGWDRPCLHLLTEFLLDKNQSDDHLDLSNLTLVLPGSRAGRRLVELLVEGSGDGIVIPPTIVTAGALPEILLKRAVENAPPIERIFLWEEALRRTQDTLLERIFPTPMKFGAGQELPLARSIDQLYVELSGENLTFTEVSERLKSYPTGVYDHRWSALSELFDVYLELLAEYGVADHYQARRVALESEVDSTLGTVVLAGTSDLNGLTRELISRSATEVHSIIFAPEELAGSFDELGCLVVSNWIAAHPPVSGEQLHFLNTSGDQARFTLDLIAHWPEVERRDVVIGVGDESLMPDFKATSQQLQIPIRDSFGESARTSGPYMFLNGVAQYLQARSFESFAALIRQTDVHGWLRVVLREQDAALADNIIGEIDRYQQEHLQARIGKGVSGAPAYSKKLLLVLDCLDDLLGEFSGGPQPLSTWVKEIQRAVLKLYGSSQSKSVVAACEALGETLSGILTASKSRERAVEPVEALQMVLTEFGTAQIPQALEPNSVEILGWLELMMDESPILILAGMNEGLIPQSATADIFLPDRVRTFLRLPDNERRYARDVYALSVNIHSRELTQLVAARTGLDTTQLKPSRLLLACDDAERARRVLSFYRGKETVSLSEDLEEADFQSQLVPPVVDSSIERMSITSFRNYLECPYRFYLENVIKRREVHDLDLELDGGSFGSLIHQILDDFAKSKVVGSESKEELQEFLSDQLVLRSSELFGRTVLPAVQVQLEQVRSRLNGFARFQAQWRGEGWKIVHSEWKIDPDKVQLKLSKGAMKLSGRIDRIDKNERTGAVAVLDYKTGDKGEFPDRVHRTREEWKDLQLPLYHYCVAEQEDWKDIQLGYILIPPNEDRVQVAFANWDDDVLAEGLERARVVAEDVRKNLFWPPSDKGRTGYLSGLISQALWSSADAA